MSLIYPHISYLSIDCLKYKTPRIKLDHSENQTRHIDSVMKVDIRVAMAISLTVIILRWDCQQSLFIAPTMYNNIFSVQLFVITVILMFMDTTQCDNGGDPDYLLLLVPMPPL